MWPILLIVAAVAALIIVIVLIVKHFDTLSGIAVATWDAIKSAAAAALKWIEGHWPLILGILTGPIGIAAALIITHWDQIKSAASRVFDAIKSGWNAMTTHWWTGW